MNVNRKKNFFMIFILLGIIIINPDIAAAVDSDIINKIVKSFADKTGKWTDIAKKYAKIIFYWCAILEIAWLGIKMSLSGADIKDTLKNFCITVVVCGFFLAVINNYYEWSRQVISGLLAISGEMGNIQNASDDAFKKGLDLCQQLFSALKEISILEDGALLLGSLAALFIVIVCFCQITAQVIFIKCEAYVAMLAACILVGFGASSFMRDYAINVLRYILAVAFKLFVMQLVIGIGYTFMQEAITPKASFYTVCVTTGVAIVLLALVKQLPDTVAGIIQGSHVSSGQALTSTVTAMGAGLMGAGLAMGAGMANVGRAAQAAKAEGAQGVRGIMKGTASNLWSATRESMHNKDMRNNTVSSSLRQRIEAARLRK